MPGREEEGIIIEFQTVGQVVKVSAVDTRTGIEAVIVGPASSPEALLRNTAIRKLRYLLAKKTQ